MSIDVLRPPATRPWAVASMLASAACWGFATVMSKGALEELPPISLLTAQLGASISFLWLIALAKGIRLHLDRSTRLAALSGVLEPGLAYALGIGGLALTSASNASLISTTEPLIVVALAFAFFRVRTSGRQLAAILVAMMGVGLVSLSEAAASSNKDAGAIGDVMIVIATGFAALYVVITSRLVVRESPLVLAILQQSVGFAFALALLCGAWALELERIEVWPSLQGWLLIISSGVVQYALAFWFYLVALRVLPVSTAALFLALIPVFGVGGAVMFLDESLGSGQLVGSLLIVAAVLAVPK